MQRSSLFPRKTPVYCVARLGTHPKFSTLVRWPLALPMWKRDRSAWGPRCVIAGRRAKPGNNSKLPGFDAISPPFLRHMALPLDRELNGFPTWHSHAHDSHGWGIEIAWQSVIALRFTHPKYKVTRRNYSLFCKISRLTKHFKIDVLKIDESLLVTLRI